MTQEIKHIECANVNPCGSDRNLPTIFNPLFSTPSINPNRNENAFLANNYGMQSNFLTSQLNFNQSLQAMQQSYNHSTQAMQQAYLAYLSNNKN